MLGVVKRSKDELKVITAIYYNYDYKKED